MLTQRWPPTHALVLTVAALQAAAASERGSGAAPCGNKDVCKTKAAAVRDWSLLQLSTRQAVPTKPNGRSGREEAALNAIEAREPALEPTGRAEAATLDEVAKPGGPSPPQACCLAMTASCLACVEGVSVEDFCADPRHADVPDCEDAAAPAPNLEPVAPTSWPSPAAEPSPGREQEVCCKAMTAACLACELGVTAEEICADPTYRNAAIPGCNATATRTAAPSPARQSRTSALPACDFRTEPVTPYFWDESCNPHGLGCYADGAHGQCRFCGEGAYAGVPCPSCAFPGPAPGSHYWDNTCRSDPGMRGCGADGLHTECRRCGDGDYQDVKCPGWLVPTVGSCTFQGKPATPHYWDPTCKQGIIGCWADGVHAECRWCGEGAYRGIPCPK